MDEEISEDSVLHPIEFVVFHATTLVDFQHIDVFVAALLPFPYTSTLNDLNTIKNIFGWTVRVG